MHNDRTRIEWVDYAKGFCIILVVMYHAAGQVEWYFGSEGFLRPVVEFARPFRIPAFFLVAGLFLSATIHGPVRQYIDRKLVHFIYFYLLWLTIHMSLLQASLLGDDPIGFAKVWAKSLFEPANSLWFIHMLAVFYTVTWLLRHLSPYILALLAFLLHSLYQLGVIDTGWNVIDRFSNRYVYFCIGYAFAPLILSLAGKARLHPVLLSAGLLGWGGVNWLAVEHGLHDRFLAGFLLAIAGAGAICLISGFLARHGRAVPVRQCGKSSLVIYLSYAVVLAASTSVFRLLGLPLGSVGAGSTLALLFALVLPLLVHGAIRATPIAFVYDRPNWARLERKAPLGTSQGQPSS